jgi:hypothetical protein
MMKKRLFFNIISIICLFGLAWGAKAKEFCYPLAPPAGSIIQVDPSQTGELTSIVANASPGDTILFTDGTYPLNGVYLWVSTPGLTIRSASGNREAVILDGNYQTTEIINVTASDVTIADLTLKRAVTHAVHVVPESADGGDISHTRIHNVHIVDPGQQAIKINPNLDSYADYGEISCCRIELTDIGRLKVLEINATRCYTGGVDAHQAWGWVIRDSAIEGFWCENGLSEHAIHMWRGCRDSLVERNILLDNARGVGFGLMTSGSARTYNDNPCPGAIGYVGHYDGIIRNNFIFQNRAELRDSSDGFDCGICLWQSCGARVLHNSVVATDEPFSSIEWRYSNTDAEITNNLASHRMIARDNAEATLAGNLEGAPMTLFLDVSTGNLHLASDATDAIDEGVFIGGGLCDEDIDGDSRDTTPDVGADEIACSLDFNSDGDVDGADLAAFAVDFDAAWRPLPKLSEIRLSSSRSRKEGRE